jgi:gliding motility-associated-like protein
MNRILFILTFVFFVNNYCTCQINLNQGLVGYWNFNGNANDISGNNNNGIVFGATLTSGKNGLPNTAYLFNGISDYIKVANNSTLNFPNDSFTLYASVKPQGFYNGTCHGNCIIDKGDNDFIPGHYALRYSDVFSSSFSNCSSPVNNSQQNYSIQVNNQVTGYGVAYMPYIDTNKWDCVIGICANDTIKTYVNSILKLVIPVSNSIGVNNYDLFFGKKNHPTYPYWLNGKLDEIRIYNRAINQLEIDSLCNLNNPVVITDSITSKFGFQYPNNCDSSTIQFTDLSTTLNSTITNWEWYFGDGNSSTLQNPLHNYSGGGVFQASLIVTSNTNKKDTFYLQVTSVENVPIVTATANSTSLCIGTPATLTGGGALTYVWTGGVTNGVPFMPNATNTYTVTGSDANGCTATASITISVGSSLPITISNSAPLLCLNDVSTLTASGANFYNWLPVSGLNTTNSATVLANPTTTTTYTVVGTDANGCTGSTSTLVDIVQPINIIVSKSNDIECGKNSAQLLATGASNYQWSPASLVSNPTSNITSTAITQTTTFYVTGTKGTCTDTDSITVEFFNSDGGNTFIPTAFSPNDDNINDCLNVKSTANFLEYYFAIYNRWGQLVFESNNAEICWEGNFNGYPAPVGTYYFFLKAKTSCGDMLKKGDITLMR